MAALICIYCAGAVTFARDLNGSSCEGHQGESGGHIARDGSIHDHGAPDRAVPERGGNQGGGSGNGGRSGGGRSSGAPGPVVSPPTVPVTIGGETFMVSQKARNDLTEFINIHKTNGAVGKVVAAFASILHVSGLITSPENVVLIDVEETVLVLSGPTVFTNAWRAQALSYIRSFISPSTAHKPEGRMWQRMQDVIRNPERYKDGGIKKDSNGKLILRALPSDRYRSIASSIEMTQMDRVHLEMLYDALRQHPIAMDYLATTGFAIGDYIDGDKGKTISVRDHLLLNKALQALDPGYKNYLSEAFSQTANSPNHTQLLWLRCAKYLRGEYWMDSHSSAKIMRHMAGYSDSLGFEDDEAAYSGGFWDSAIKELQATGTPRNFQIYFQPLPATGGQWKAPPQRVYTFYWP